MVIQSQKGALGRVLDGGFLYLKLKKQLIQLDGGTSL